MNVSLTPELKEFVQERVRSGRYTSGREVVRQALRGSCNTATGSGVFG